MAKLYREHVLGEKPVEGLVSLDSIRPASNNAAAPSTATLQNEPVAGD